MRRERPWTDMRPCTTDAEPAMTCSHYGRRGSPSGADDDFFNSLHRISDIEVKAL